VARDALSVISGHSLYPLSHNVEKETPSARDTVVMVRYTFGDDEPARRRLALVAAAYEPVSCAFVAAHVPPGSSVVDLGCGPGFSTDLLARTAHPRSLVGVDTSESFLRAARARVPEAQFLRHDVTVVPLPVAAPEVIYARLVLAHLPDPPAVVERWCRALAPGGVVLSEELEAIDAPPGPLRDYDEVSAAMVRRGGGVMCAGPLLADLGGRCVRVEAGSALAARIYAFNVRLWVDRHEEPAPRDDLVELERELAAMAGAPDGPGVAWIVRQTVVGPPARGAGA
jgi:SAM-dependent methyltransferase